MVKGRPVTHQLALFLLCVICPPLSVCQEDGTVNDGKNYVAVSVEASREHPEVGSGLQINGTIRNDSQNPVLLSEHTSVVTVPLEVDRTPEVGYYFARFTTVDELKCTDEANQNCSEQCRGNKNDCYESLLILRAGETTHAFWRVNKNEASTSGGRAGLKSYTFFPPGDYKFSAQIRYWPLTSDADLAKQHLTLQDLRNSQYNNQGYRSATATLTSHLNAPQLIILFGAFIGGLTAFVLAIVRTPPKWRPIKEKFLLHLLLNVGEISLNAIAAVVFSCVFTILLSRLSDTSFPVKITVSDFWGAITIGFVAAYFGRSWLDKYLKGSGSS